MRRLTHLIVLLAFVFSCGGQWAAIQGLAWANMVREFAQVVPLQQALKMTFSGKYPCSICKALAEKKSLDQEKALALDKYDKKFITPVVLTAAPPRVAVYHYLVFLQACPSRFDRPPVPPPRSALS